MDTFLGWLFIVLVEESSRQAAMLEEDDDGDASERRFGVWRHDFSVIRTHERPWTLANILYCLVDALEVFRLRARALRTDRRVLLLVLVETAASPVVSNQCMYRVK